MSYLTLTAIRVEQPLGEFYITKFKAKDLLEISFSEELTYIDENGRLKGTQRKKDDKRLREIAKYIDSVEMSFPNSIILAANYSQIEGEVVEDEEVTWKLEQINESHFQITIPTKKKLAAIIDGQHRLRAFEYIEDKKRLDLEIPCSIFFDLTINNLESEHSGLGLNNYVIIVVYNCIVLITTIFISHFSYQYFEKFFMNFYRNKSVSRKNFL